MKLTFFKCGGFALGISNNHVTFDGISFKNFLENLASLAAGEQQLKLPAPPFTNRHLLSTRSPPRVSFPHPELVETSFLSASSILQLSPSDLNFKLLHLSAANISSLKLLSKPHAARPTSFNVVVAYLWRCKSASSMPESPTEEYLKQTSMVLYAVDIRKKVSPPLPPEYTGNAVLTAYGNVAVEEVVEGEFGKVVEAVAQGAERMSDDYVRSVIDWGTLHRGFPKGDMIVSSWWKLGFADVEYPWGKPVYTCPVAHPQADIILLFPSIGGVDKGVNVLVALPTKDMERFEDVFYKLLPTHA